MEIHVNVSLISVSLVAIISHTRLFYQYLSFQHSTAPKSPAHSRCAIRRQSIRVHNWSRLVTQPARKWPSACFTGIAKRQSNRHCQLHRRMRAREHSANDRIEPDCRGLFDCGYRTYDHQKIVRWRWLLGMNNCGIWTAWDLTNRWHA